MKKIKILNKKAKRKLVILILIDLRTLIAQIRKKALFKLKQSHRRGYEMKKKENHKRLTSVSITCKSKSL